MVNDTLSHLLDDGEMDALRRRFSDELRRVNVKDRCLLWKRRRPMRENERRDVINALLPELLAAVGYRPLLRTDILNYLIRERGYRSYLEIGVQNPGGNFDWIEAAEKDGVDPAGNCNYCMTSDEFFVRNPRSYDLIFIDGLHLAEQVERDVDHALACLNPRGAILLHDCNPPREKVQTEEWDGTGAWCGTVWKAVARLRMSRPDLLMCTVNADYGVGVIELGEQTLFPSMDAQDLTYAVLERHRTALLNLISFQEFRARIEGAVCQQLL